MLTCILVAVNCLQGVNVLYRQLMYYIADYLMCNGILYLVLKLNFAKNLHVKMKHSTTFTKRSTNVSSAFHFFICGTELKEVNEGCGHFNASLQTRNQEMEDICLISLNSTK